MGEKLDFSATWATMSALIRSHMELVAAVAGVFILLPQLLFRYFMPVPTVTPGSPPDAILSFYGDIWPWIIAIGIASTIGNVAIIRLMSGGPGQRVGDALTDALRLAVTFIVAGLITGLAIGFGFILLLVPGFYLLARLILAASIVAIERQMNPIAAIRRSWQLTAGNVLRILGFFLLLLLVGVVATAAINAIFAIIFNMLLPVDGALFAVSLISAITTSVFSVVMIAAYVATYRELGGDSHANLAATFE